MGRVRYAICSQRLTSLNRLKTPTRLNNCRHPFSSLHVPRFRREGKLPGQDRAAGRSRVGRSVVTAHG